MLMALIHAASEANASVAAHVQAALPTDVSVPSDGSGLPGGGALSKIVGGLKFYGLIAAVGALIVSGLVWAFSSQGGNYQGASRGKTGVMVAAAAAFLIGSADIIINFANNAGAAAS